MKEINLIENIPYTGAARCTLLYFLEKEFDSLLTVEQILARKDNYHDTLLTLKKNRSVVEKFLKLYCKFIMELQAYTFNNQIDSTIEANLLEMKKYKKRWLGTFSSVYREATARVEALKQAKLAFHRERTDCFFFDTVIAKEEAIRIDPLGRYNHWQRVANIYTIAINKIDRETIISGIRHQK